VEVDRTRLTDPSGRFRYTQLLPDTYDVEIQHVAYHPHRTRVVLLPSGERAWTAVHLSPRTYLFGEVRAEKPPVMPLTSDERAAYRIHPEAMTEFPLDGLADAVELLPGVTVSGDRPFFRGIGFEQVIPLIDGIPAREPIKGEWILPPPQAVSSAEFISEAIGAEAGQSLAGVVSFRLAEGGDSPLTRLGYKTDRPGVQWRSDNAEAGTSGPTGIRGLYYSASCQGYFTDTYLRYSHDLPSQSILGAIPLGNRMYGNQTASVKLTMRPPGHAWKVTAALVHSREREKSYHDHYSRSGWVGYFAPFDRYTTFIGDPAEADSAVFYDGPSRVPVHDARSSLAFLTASRGFGQNGSLNLSALYGAYRSRDDIEGGDIDTDASLREWSRHGITLTTHQEEWFYATHGNIPEFESAESREGGLGCAAKMRVRDRHDLAIGARVTGGDHRYASVPAYNTVIGSLETPLHSADAYGYIEDTWFSDKLSSMSLSLRTDFREVSQGDVSASGSTWAPSIAFHQPMSERDAFHTQAGLSYQFPSLQTYFIPSGTRRTGFDMDAQKMEFFEVGIQHHYSRSVVAYIGAYRRDYSKIVFSARNPTELEAAFGVRVLPPQFIGSDGIELVVDHQPRSNLVGQVSVAWSKTTQNDVEAPWSRRLAARSWLSWQVRPSVSTTLTAGWNTGRPYEICIKPRGCTEAEMLKGRLPQPVDVNLALRWGPRPRRIGIQLLAEIRNLLNRRIPTFDFGVNPMRVGSGNFLAFYHERRETGGYTFDADDQLISNQVSNPQTRAPGRNVLVGAEIQF
jgi:hypothetical protein